MSEFIAPEQVQCKSLSEVTDIYNFGATLYWALTHHRVPSFLTVKESEWDSLIEQPYPTPHMLNPQVPEPLSKLTMWCCQVSFGSRPKDMNMVIGGLETVAKAIQAATPAPPPAPTPASVRQGQAARSARPPSRASRVAHPLSFGDA